MSEIVLLLFGFLSGVVLTRIHLDARIATLDRQKTWALEDAEAWESSFWKMSARCKELAEHIQRSEGPSGLNKDYLLSLEVALDNLSLESGDEHVKDLADRVRLLEQSIYDSHITTEAVYHELRKVGSTDEQEETEK